MVISNPNFLEPGTSADGPGKHAFAIAVNGHANDVPDFLLEQSELLVKHRFLGEPGS